MARRRIGQADVIGLPEPRYGASPMKPAGLIDRPGIDRTLARIAAATKAGPFGRPWA